MRNSGKDAAFVALDTVSIYSIEMLAKIYKLRRNGAKLNIDRTKIESLGPGQFAHGCLYWGSPHGSPELPKAVHLCKVASTPGMGIIFTLYQPRLVGVGYNWLMFSGVEEADGAAVVQDWFVELATASGVD